MPAVARIGVMLLAVAGAIATPSRTRADERPTAVLTYERLAGASGCPAQAALERSVASHLGYDPFQPTGTVAVHARIRPQGAGMHAVVEARDRAGASLGRRQLASASNDCVELARALALAISVAIDPLAPFTRAEPEPESAPRPPPPPPAPASPAPPSPAPRAPPPPAVLVAPAPRPPPAQASGRAREDWKVNLALLAGYGVLPVPRPALALAVQRRVGPGLSLEAGGRYDVAGEASGRSGGKATASRASLALGVCAGDALAACGGVAGGRLFAAGRELDQEQEGAAWLAVLELSLRASLRLGRWGLEARVGAERTLPRPRLTVNHEEAWTAPPVAAHVGVGLARWFP